MIQLENYADERQTSLCAYCGNFVAKLTRDHSPSKVFLNKPYPENLSIVPACLTCNNNFSFDEEYVAYWVVIALYKQNGIKTNRYEKVIRAIERTPHFKKMFLETSLFERDDLLPIEEIRLKNILYKLANGHILFHHSNPQYEAPKIISWFFLQSLNENNRGIFELELLVEIYPEVGSRAILAINQYDYLYYPWIIAQEGVYRYLVADSKNSQIVKIVFSEFLACEVIWNDI
ncbi:MAG: hypothetical protein RL154_1389 [Pseudomonadota bacterium]|jgi:hypothetical protein